MLRRKTDPKTGKQTLCEPAQSKYTRTFHKSILCGNLQEKCRTPILRHQPAQSKCTRTFHKKHFVWKFKKKMPDTNPAASVLREPAQSKGTWTFHKSIFVSKFTGKMAADTSGNIVLCEPAQSKCTCTFRKSHFVSFCMETGHTVWGKMLNSIDNRLSCMEKNAIKKSETPQCRRNKRARPQPTITSFNTLMKTNLISLLVNALLNPESQFQNHSNEEPISRRDPCPTGEEKW